MAIALTWKNKLTPRKKATEKYLTVRIKINLKKKKTYTVRHLYKSSMLQNILENNLEQTVGNI